MIANYQPINDIELAKIRKVSDESIIETLEQMQDEEEKVLDIDQMWDALHFLFTGIRAFEPVEEGLLSEAVVGEYVFDTEEYIGYSSKERVKEIAEKLNETDFKKITENFALQDLVQAEIFPNIWYSESRDSVLEELEDYFNMMQKFYQDMAKANRNVLVSIY